VPEVIQNCETLSDVVILKFRFREIPPISLLVVVTCQNLTQKWAGGRVHAHHIKLRSREISCME